MRFDRLSGREFITLIGGAAVWLDMRASNSHRTRPSLSGGLTQGGASTFLLFLPWL
jgi:hypothetical protein